MHAVLQAGTLSASAVLRLMPCMLGACLICKAAGPLSDAHSHASALDPPFTPCCIARPLAVIDFHAIAGNQAVIINNNAVQYSGGARQPDSQPCLLPWLLEASWTSCLSCASHMAALQEPDSERVPQAACAAAGSAVAAATRPAPTALCTPTRGSTTPLRSSTLVRSPYDKVHHVAKMRQSLKP